MNTQQTVDNNRCANDSATQIQEKQYSAADFYEVGDILYTVWGWEQTNVDFYIVESMTRCTLKVREIGGTMTDYLQHGMAGHIVPDVEDKKDAVHNVRVDKNWRLGRIDGHYASLWDGRSKYCSWYA